MIIIVLLVRRPVHHSLSLPPLRSYVHESSSFVRRRARLLLRTSAWINNVYYYRFMTRRENRMTSTTANNSQTKTLYFLVAVRWWFLWVFCYCCCCRHLRCRDVARGEEVVKPNALVAERKEITRSRRAPSLQRWYGWALLRPSSRLHYRSAVGPSTSGARKCCRLPAATTPNMWTPWPHSRMTSCVCVCRTFRRQRGLNLNPVLFNFFCCACFTRFHTSCASFSTATRFDKPESSWVDYFFLNNCYLELLNIPRNSTYCYCLI